MSLVPFKKDSETAPPDVVQEIQLAVQEAVRLMDKCVKQTIQPFEDRVPSH